MFHVSFCVLEFQALAVLSLISHVQCWSEQSYMLCSFSCLTVPLYYQMF